MTLPETLARALFVSVHAYPDGTAKSVTVYAERPGLDDIASRYSVWEVPVPDDFADDDTVGATLVASSLIGGDTYADEDRAGWEQGRQVVSVFHAEGGRERIMLRRIEAQLINAGYYDARTQETHCQGWGVRFHVAGHWCAITRFEDGWTLIGNHPEDRWACFGTVAVPEATPEAIVAAGLAEAVRIFG
ncbi:hypothetical protein [Streptomyces chartreusis]|uniref:hypothetical protein n=1 Tax=Streptomyces chartreusis TaxID=1969 RepID=UPI003681A83D